MRAAVAAAEDAARARIRATLAAGGIDVVAEPGRAQDLVAVAELMLDAAVLDFDAELMVSPAELMEVRTVLPELPLVVVSESTGQRAVRKALRAGAHGYVYEDELETTLVPTLEAVVAGQVCVPVDVRHQVVRPTISHREKQVLELAARGYTNLQIAHELYLAESTVKSHLSTCFRKLGVRSRAEAAALVLDPDARVELGLGTPLATNDSLVAEL